MSYMSIFYNMDLSELWFIESKSKLPLTLASRSYHSPMPCHANVSVKQTTRRSDAGELRLAVLSNRILNLDFRWQQGRSISIHA